jgi:hypothetical protein
MKYYHFLFSFSIRNQTNLPKSNLHFPELGSFLGLKESNLMGAKLIFEA